jgi:hypothetical protein
VLVRTIAAAKAESGRALHAAARVPKRGRSIVIILQEKMAGVIFSGLAKMTLVTLSLFSCPPERPKSTPRLRLKDWAQSSLELGPIRRKRGSGPIGAIRGEPVEAEVGISS